MDPVRHLFLDLEDTIITPVLDGWYNTHLINVEKIRAFMVEFKPDYLHLFSFAVWNQAELLWFDDGTRPMIEKSLGMRFSTTMTVDDEILPRCISVMGLTRGCLDFSDMSDFWGKHEAFRLNMRFMFKSGSTPVEVALLDDAVYNETFTWPDMNLTGRILNIDQMD